MRAFISVDLEGMPFVVSREHLIVKGALYNEARKIATRVVLTVTDELHRQGVDEVWVADSHGPMVNILPEDLPEYISLLRGFPRPVCMVNGVENSDFVVFLGYHAKAGTAYSTFDHTYSGLTIASLVINGIEASEFLLNAWAAGHYDVPVVLVAGEEKLLSDDVAKYAPWVERIILKRSASRYAAISPSLTRIGKELRSGVARAVEKFRNGECKPLKTNYPVEMRVKFFKSSFTDAAELIPGAERIDALTVKFTAKDIIEAYKVFQLMTLAAFAINAITTPR